MDDEGLESEAAAAAAAAAFVPREYQIEMLEASLERNIIVAVGKSPFLHTVMTDFLGSDGHGFRQDTNVGSQVFALERTYSQAFKRSASDSC